MTKAEILMAMNSTMGQIVLAVLLIVQYCLMYYLSSTNKYRKITIFGLIPFSIYFFSPAIALALAINPNTFRVKE